MRRPLRCISAVVLASALLQQQAAWGADSFLHDDTRPAERRESSGGGVGAAHIAGLAGLAAGVGLALVFKQEADDRYEEYLTTADPDRAASLLREAEQYDRRAMVGWVVAQASFVALFYLLTRPPENDLIPVEGEPVIKRSSGELQLGWRLRF